MALYPISLDGIPPVVPDQIIASAAGNVQINALNQLEASVGIMSQWGGFASLNAAVAACALISQIQYMAYNYSSDTGTPNAFVVTLSPAPAAYAAGMTIVLKAANASTGACTVNVNSLGAVTLLKNGGSPIASGDIVSGQILICTYDGSAFQTVIGGRGGSGSVTLTGDVTGSGTGTIATTIAATGVTAGAYPKVSVNAKGQVTAGTTLSPSDIPSGYTGGSSISTVGTVTAGTWNATAISAAYGGTGLATPASGTLLYGSGSGTMNQLPIGSNNQVLTVVSGALAWATPTSGNASALCTPGVVNGNSGTAVIGTPVYQTSTAGQFNFAEANASATVRVIGLVYDTSIASGSGGNVQTAGYFQFASTAQVDAVCGTSGGFRTIGQVFYLSDATAGTLTSTAPTTAGHFLVPVLQAATSTSAWLLLPAQILGL